MYNTNRAKTVSAKDQSHFYKEAMTSLAAPCTCTLSAAIELILKHVFEKVKVSKGLSSYFKKLQMVCA
jgi:hypothetical protein